MSTYTYERLRIESKPFDRSKPFDNYIDIINDKASHGWRLVTIVSPPEVMTTSGKVYIDLIFEKLEQNE